MTAERTRIDFLTRRDGPEAARAWVRRTLGIYRDALANASSHAATPDFRPLFEEAIREYEAFLGTEPGP